MLCNQCQRSIAEDSVYCAYCGAHQPEPEPVAPLPEEEPYVPSLPRRIFGWFVTAVMLAVTAAILYLLSSTRTTVMEGWLVMFN